MSHPLQRSPLALLRSRGLALQREWSVCLPSASLEQVGNDTALLGQAVTGSEGSSRLAAGLSLRDGTILWSQKLEAYGIDGSCTDGTRFFRYEGGDGSRRLVTRDLRTGKIHWQVPVPVHSRALTCGTDAVLTMDDYPDRFIQAWDPANGRELWNAGVLPEAARKRCFPVAVANGLAYLSCDGNPRGGSSYEDSFKYLLMMEARTGKVVADGLFNPTQSAQYNLGQLEWSERHGLLFGNDTTFYEYSPSLRAADGGARLVWSQEGVGRFAMVGNTLVCEASRARTGSNYSARTGLAGVDAKTGKVLWRQKGATADDTLLGAWKDCAVVFGPRGNPEKRGQRYRLAGLNSSGGVAWSVEFRPGPEFATGPTLRLAGERILLVWCPTGEKTSPVLESYRLPR